MSTSYPDQHGRAIQMLADTGGYQYHCSVVVCEAKATHVMNTVSRSWDIGRTWLCQPHALDYATRYDLEMPEEA